MIPYTDIDNYLKVLLVDEGDRTWNGQARGYAIREACLQVDRLRPELRAVTMSVVVNGDGYTFDLGQGHTRLIQVIGLLPPGGSVCRSLLRVSEEDATKAEPCWRCESYGRGPDGQSEFTVSSYVYSIDSPYTVWLVGHVPAGTELRVRATPAMPTDAQLRADGIPFREDVTPELINAAMSRLHGMPVGNGQLAQLYSQMFLQGAGLKQSSDERVNPAAHTAERS